MVQLLLRHGADPTHENSHRSFCLAEATSQGWQHIVTALLNVKRYAQTLIEQQDWLGRSALHAAAISGHANILHILLTSGASSALRE